MPDKAIKGLEGSSPIEPAIGPSKDNAYSNQQINIASSWRDEAEKASNEPVVLQIVDNTKVGSRRQRRLKPSYKKKS